LPQADQALLVVEIGLSSLSHDRGVKLPAYAEAGIPEVWIVNLEDNQVEVYCEPLGKAYRLRLLLQPGETITPLALPEASAIAIL
jgi:Uma2 family endonuclease